MSGDITHLLACPAHRRPLERREQSLLCPAGCTFPIVDGVPFLLRRGIEHTHPRIAARSFEAAEEMATPRRVEGAAPPKARVDSFVQDMVANTNSNLYRRARGRLDAYPIPEFPLAPARSGDRLLDIGCSWGRWCIAAARRGFAPVGIDPSLEAVLAGRRIAEQLGVDAAFVVGDSRFLPFREQVFDAAFSYSVLQHFSREDVLATLRALAPCLKPGAVSKLHLLNRYGLRSVQVQLFRLFREARGFETRYWAPAEMIDAFSSVLGPSSLEIDGFFVQGRYEDRHLFTWRHRLIVELSHILTGAARRLPVLAGAADNLFVVSRVAAP
jgi:2-polyprenyl-3-methyl-5-hydroxy-6-metoxy-1,4-benzoquinol methylase